MKVLREEVGDAEAAGTAYLTERGGSGARFVVVVTAPELVLLSNALGESLEAVEEWEFQTRLGETRETARQLRTDLKAALATGP